MIYFDISVKLAPVVLPHCGPVPNCGEICPIPPYPQWSNAANYQPAYPLMFGVKTKPPPGYSPAACPMVSKSLVFGVISIEVRG